jgi:plasmanylethanolamine desaturase
MVLLQIFLLMLIADFTTGLVHFWMDQYGREDMPFVGKHVIEINILHHSKPRNMVKKNYFQLTYTSWLLGLIVGAVALGVGGFTWQVLFVIVYAGNANQIHKWAHQTADENGPLVTFLQRLHLIQSRHHHRHHHNAPYDRNYCILTDWLNPVLHSLRFWEGVVWFFRKFGFQPVAGTKIREFV